MIKFPENLQLCSEVSHQCKTVKYNTLLTSLAVFLSLFSDIFTRCRLHYYRLDWFFLDFYVRLQYCNIILAVLLLFTKFYFNATM